MSIAMVYGTRSAHAKTHPDDRFRYNEVGSEQGADSIREALVKSTERFAAAPMFSGVFMAVGKNAARVMMCPPDTWKPYLIKRDYYGIYEMEAHEFARAVMAPVSEHRDVDKELTHMVAALMMCVIYRDE